MPTGLNEDLQEGMVPVTLPSGALFSVHDSEFQYFKQRATKYMTDNDFTNVADYQDLDRLLILELQIYRAGLAISNQRDYWGEPVDENAMKKSLVADSAESRQLKKQLGLDRETREKSRGEDSPENYLHMLRQRAKHFKHKLRYPQSAKAIEHYQELRGIVTLHLNCDERERIELGVTAEQVIKWMEEKLFPEFQKIDDKFREEQATWINQM